MPITNLYQSIEKYQNISDHEKWDKANQKLAIKDNDGITIDVVKRSSARSWCSVVFYVILFPLGLARLAIAGYSAPRSRESNKKLIEKFIDDVKKTPSTETREKVLEELNEKLQKKKAISPSEARNYVNRIMNHKNQLSIDNEPKMNHKLSLSESESESKIESESEIEEKNENKQIAERFTEMVKNKLNCARELKNFLKETNNKIGPLPEWVPTAEQQKCIRKMKTLKMKNTLRRALKNQFDNQQKEKLVDETSLEKKISAKDLAIGKMIGKINELEEEKLDDYLKVKGLDSNENIICPINEIPLHVLTPYDFVDEELQETKNFKGINVTVEACLKKLKKTEIHSNMMTIARTQAPKKKEELIDKSPFFKDYEDFLAYYKKYTNLIQNLREGFRVITLVRKTHNEIKSIDGKQFPIIKTLKKFNELSFPEQVICCLYGREWIDHH